MKRITILSVLALLTIGLSAKATAQTTNEVYLDDRESHSWSYYSDPTCLIRSLNPADVKITYFGYGTATMYSSNDAAPAGSPDVDVAASAVGIGIDAPGKNTYVYLKTLERVNGKQAASMAAANGPCRYTTIPNPFSLRPTHGTGEARWRGFYKWRLRRVSGGAVYADQAMGTPVAQGDMVDAEQELFLSPAAATGMEVEFEAIWARAFVFPYVATLNSASEGNFATGTNAYERNFMIINSTNHGGGSTTAFISAQHPLTFSAVYPDGTDGSSTSRLTAVPTSVWFSQGYECQADTKFEYLVIQSPSNTLQINGNLCVLGRGIKPYYDDSRCFYFLTGVRSSQSGDCSVRWRIESGVYNIISFLGIHPNNDPDRPLNGQYYLDFAGVVSCKATLGNDYDRSLADNSKLKVLSHMRGSSTVLYNGLQNKHSDNYVYTIKSGSFQPDMLGSALGMEGFYMGSTSGSGSPLYQGKRFITVEGGNLATIAGGVDHTAQEGYVEVESEMVNIRVKGGTIRGCVYGAAEFSTAKGSRRFVITGGEINGWVAGGCNGSQTTGGWLNGDTYIYLGGNARLAHTSDNLINFSRGGNIYGAGSGHSDATGDDATVGRVNNSTIVLADGGYVSRNIFGGGNYGYIIGTGSAIQVLGGTLQGKVFGGSNRQRGKQVDIEMRDGQVVGGIHGGSNILGTVSGPITIRVTGGTVGEPGCSDELGNVFGCGYGEETHVTGDVNVYIGDAAHSTPHRDSPLIHSSVYCGGYQGSYNSTGHTFRVTTHNGRIKGSVFGGGYGTNAVITGDTDVRVLGTTHIETNVYGGGNMGKVTGNTRVIIGD